MTTFGFGQRTGQIVQTAYVVQRIRPAIDSWINDAKAGPFFLLDSFTGGDQRYRGQPTTADVSIAMGFAGHMMIELMFSAPVPSGGTVYYMGEGAGAPGFVELIPATPGMDEMFTRYWQASVDWDGKDPIRPFG